MSSFFQQVSIIGFGILGLSSLALSQEPAPGDESITAVRTEKPGKAKIRGVGLRQANSLGGGPAPVSGDRKFQVFIFMGQSNMTGHGWSVDLDSPYNRKHERIRVWANNRWEYLVPRRNFGPETAFAHKMANGRPDSTIGIIKVAVGATGLAAWKPDYDRKLATTTKDGLKGSLYRDLMDAVSSAREKSKFEIDGFVWKHGGKDSRKAHLAGTYQQRFIELVDRMRMDLSAPEMPVYVLTYFDKTGIEEHRKKIARVRANALPIFSSQATVSEYLASAFPVFHGRLPTRPDKVHFNSKGQLKLGEMTAEAVLNHLFAAELEGEGEKLPLSADQ